MSESNRVRDYCTSGKYRRHMAIVMVLNGVMRTFNAGKRSKGRKKYCYPSQDKILDLLRQYHGIVCTRRTLNYDLKELEEGTGPLGRGITRIRRHRRGENGAMEMHSTAYYIAKQACMRMFRQLMRMQTVVFSRVQSFAQYKCFARKDSSESAQAYGFERLNPCFGGDPPPLPVA